MEMVIPTSQGYCEVQLKCECQCKLPGVISGVEQTMVAIRVLSSTCSGCRGGLVLVVMGADASLAWKASLHALNPISRWKRVYPPSAALVPIGFHAFM